MKVKIGDKVYDAENQPVMVILSNENKENISNMGTQTKYCCFPDDWNIDDIIKFMKVEG